MSPPGIEPVTLGFFSQTPRLLGHHGNYTMTLIRRHISLKRENCLLVKQSQNFPLPKAKISTFTVYMYEPNSVR